MRTCGRPARHLPGFNANDGAECFFFLLEGLGGATEVSCVGSVALGLVFFFAGELEGDVSEVRFTESESPSRWGLFTSLIRSVISGFVS